MHVTPPFRLKAGELMPLTQRSNGPAARRALGHLGAIALAGAALWLALGTVWSLPLTFLLGYLLAFLFSALHETAHQTPFRTRALNHALGHLAGLVLVLPYEYYRAFHWDHHRFTRDPDRDPELLRAQPTSRWGLLWTIGGLPTWRDRLRLLLRHGVLGRVDLPWVPADKRALVVREARGYLAVYAVVIAVSIATGSLAAVWLWLVPVIVGHWFLRPYLLAEHTGCDHSADMLANTRTTYTNGWVRFFAWNMPYHAAHHAYPAVPFHALPRLDALIADHTRHSARGYRAATAAVWHHAGADRRARAQAEAHARI